MFNIGDKVEVVKGCFIGDTGIIASYGLGCNYNVRMSDDNEYSFNLYELVHAKNKFKIGDKICEKNGNNKVGIITYITECGHSAVIKYNDGFELMVYLAGYEHYIEKPKFKFNVGDIIKHKNSPYTYKVLSRIVGESSIGHFYILKQKLQFGNHVHYTVSYMTKDCIEKFCDLDKNQIELKLSGRYFQGSLEV